MGNQCTIDCEPTRGGTICDYIADTVRELNQDYTTHTTPIPSTPISVLIGDLAMSNRRQKAYDYIASIPTEFAYIRSFSSDVIILRETPAIITMADGTELTGIQLIEQCLPEYKLAYNSAAIGDSASAYSITVMARDECHSRILGASKLLNPDAIGNNRAVILLIDNIPRTMVYHASMVDRDHIDLWRHEMQSAIGFARENNTDMFIDANQIWPEQRAYWRDYIEENRPKFAFGWREFDFSFAGQYWDKVPTHEYMSDFAPVERGSDEVIDPESTRRNTGGIVPWVIPRSALDIAVADSDFSIIYTCVNGGSLARNRSSEDVFCFDYVATGPTLAAYIVQVSGFGQAQSLAAQRCMDTLFTANKDRLEYGQPALAAFDHCMFMITY